MKTTSLATASLALVLGLSGSALGAEPAPKPFPHKQHVAEQEMPCTACHDMKGTPLPTLKTKGCLKCHGDGVPAYAGLDTPKPAVSLPHLAHASKLDCGDCHQAVVEDRHPAKTPLLAPGACGKCHEEKKVKLEMSACAKCHGKDMKREEPASHDGTWRTRHGLDAQWTVFPEHGKDCRECHQPKTCKTCHAEELPRDHTGLWRVRTHGAAAGWDRDRCKTCHETGTCVRCHRDTRPLNHTGMWKQTHGLTAGGRTNETCNVCHRASECAACHAGR